MWLRRASSIASLESGRAACSSGEGRSSLSMGKKREFRELSACQRTLVLFLFLASLLHAFTCLHHALETSARHPRYFGRDTLPAIASREERRPSTRILPAMDYKNIVTYITRISRCVMRSDCLTSCSPFPAIFHIE